MCWSWCNSDGFEWASRLLKSPRWNSENGHQQSRSIEKKMVPERRVRKSFAWDEILNGLAPGSNFMCVSFLNDYAGCVGVGKLARCVTWEGLAVTWHPRWKVGSERMYNRWSKPSALAQSHLMSAPLSLRPWPSLRSNRITALFWPTMAQGDGDRSLAWFMQVFAMTIKIDQN